MLSLRTSLCGWLAWMLVLPLVAAAQPAGETVLAQNARMRLTVSDYEAALVRLVPEERRADFSASPKHINALLVNLLLRKTLAAEAIEAGLDREPIPEGSDRDSVLAQRRLAKLDADAKADFERRIESFTAKAREDYLVARQSFVVPEQVEFSMIVVSVDARGEGAALDIARKVRAEAVRGGDFAALAKQFSEHPDSAANGGRYEWSTRQQLYPAIAEVLFAMKDTGEMSEPIRVRNAYYLVRLDGKRPARQQTFDEVKDRILATLKGDHVEAWRKVKTEEITMDPGLRVNQPAVDALVTTPDPELLRRALQAVPASPPSN